MKNKNSLIIAISIFVLILGGIAFTVFNNNKESSGQKTVSFREGIWANLFGSAAHTTADQPQDTTNPPVYAHPANTYSLSIPAGLEATAYKEGEAGETTLFQDTSKEKGFQVFVTPFDEPGPLTEERIHTDLPDLVIESPQDISIGLAYPAFAFYSEDQLLGSTYEVWLIHNNNLYQISTYADLDGWINDILQTWRFK